MQHAADLSSVKWFSNLVAHSANHTSDTPRDWICPEMSAGVNGSADCVVLRRNGLAPSQDGSSQQDLWGWVTT